MSGNYKSGFVSIIGRPNVGKSTLLNSILGEKVAIVTNKPQTTRNIIRGIYTTENAQIVFVDTPGIHEASVKLSQNMLKMAHNSLNDADIVLFIVAAQSSSIKKGDVDIIKGFKTINRPIFLAINKTDTIQKGDVLPLIEQYSKFHSFAEIIPISATKGDNIMLLKDSIISYLERGPKYFSSENLTDMPDSFIIEEMIREKALYMLSEEIPHGIAVLVEQLAQRNNKDIIDIEATIYCEKQSHKGIIIGKQGDMIKKIGIAAKNDIQRLYEAKINLQLWVKVKKGWRNSDFYLKSFGLNADK